MAAVAVWMCALADSTAGTEDVLWDAWDSAADAVGGRAYLARLDLLGCTVDFDETSSTQALDGDPEEHESVT